MDTKILKLAKKILEARAPSQADAAEAIEIVSADLLRKNREITAQHKKVQDAIDRGTKLTKRRIPL